MKKWIILTSSILVLIALSELAVHFDLTPRRLLGKTIETDLYHLKLINHEKSVEGVFLLTLIENLRDLNKPYASELLALDSNGQIRFKRSFKNEKRGLFVMEFKNLSKDRFSYFLSSDDHVRCASEIHFLDQEYKDLLLTNYHLNDPDLDCHDIFLHKNGDFFVLIARKNMSEAFVDSEIQEQTASGDRVFSWNVRYQISQNKLGKADRFDMIHDEQLDPIHMNSFTMGEPGEMFIGLCNLNEIVKIHYPSGLVLEQIKKPEWKFVGDPLDGFGRFHALEYLGNHRILLFDNGSNERNISRAVEYELDENKKTAKMVWEFRSYGPNKYRYIGGSAERLPNGNTLIGWGSLDDNVPMLETEQHLIFTEVNIQGKIVRELYSTEDVSSYRVHFKPD